MYLLHCVISFMITSPETGLLEKRSYKAVGTAKTLDSQYLNVDFSKWQKKHKIDLPWTTRNVNVNNCNVIRLYGHELNIPEEQF